MLNGVGFENGASSGHGTDWSNQYQTAVFSLKCLRDLAPRSRLARFSVAFGIPVLFHPIGVVLFYYGVAGLVTGTALSVVFQVAHCVGEAEFPLPRASTGRIDNAWAFHQAETTVDFARRSRVVTWLVGGLNFQIEHHLFPRISHVNYPAMSKLVEQTCRDFGIRYTEFKSFRAGMVSHFRWLRRMGMPNATG